MTPLDLRIKELMRKFLDGRMKNEKARTANMATGFVIREVELESFLDDMWLFINKALLEDQKNGTQEK